MQEGYENALCRKKKFIGPKLFDSGNAPTKKL